MSKIRAIYIGDVRFDQCPVFELNPETDHFEMLADKEFRYEKEVVEEDSDFLIFVVKDDEATLVLRNCSLYNKALKEVFYEQYDIYAQ